MPEDGSGDERTTQAGWFAHASTIAKALSLPLRVPGSAVMVTLRRAS
jgi:hypothetical protein